MLPLKNKTYIIHRNKLIQYLFGHSLPLFLGCLIYINYRPNILIFWKWISNTPLDYLSQTIYFHKPLYLNYWVINSLPGGMYVFSYCSFILLLNKNNLSKESIFWYMMIPIWAVISEIGQHFNLIIGTFDTIDFIFYLIGSLIPIIIFKNKK